MAKPELNPTFAALRGKLGEMVHRHVWGKQVASRLPDFSNRELSEKQRAQVNRFTTSGLKWTGLPDEVKARYQARAKELQMPPCALYQKTSSRPPSVEELDLSQYSGQAGQLIRVRPVDLVDVARVEVVLRQAGGDKLESGAATRPVDGSPYWTYQTTTAVASPAGMTIEAIAVNWPGKSASRVQILGVSA